MTDMLAAILALATLGDEAPANKEEREAADARRRKRAQEAQAAWKAEQEAIAAPYRFLKHKKTS